MLEICCRDVCIFGSVSYIFNDISGNCEERCFCCSELLIVVFLMFFLKIVVILNGISQWG